VGVAGLCILNNPALSAGFVDYLMHQTCPK
jgi:hypothetical protein